MKILLLCFLPIIAGLIGWFTNFLAVKMLFHPREPKKILGITFHGVFPKRQAHVAEKVGQLVANELLASEDILLQISNPENIQSINDKLERKLKHYFDVSLIEKYPLVGRFLPEKIKVKIQEEVLLEVEDLAPELIKAQVQYLEHNLNIEAMITEKVNQLSSKKLEEVIWNILSTEFQFIEWVGAILGFCIGVIQVILTVLIL